MNAPRPLLIELHYFPSILFFALAQQRPAVVLEQHEHYAKRSFRNRTRIQTANGPLRLTIPLVKGKNQQQPIREVRISYEENWPRKHWMALQSAYGNAPYFEFYDAEIRALFFAKKNYLFEYNLLIVNELQKLLGLSISWQLSQQFAPKNYPGWDDWRERVHPRMEKIAALSCQPPYPQVFADKAGFQPNLSILDLLFCKGPESGLYLTEYAQTLRHHHIQ